MINRNSESIIAHRGASAYAPENTFAAFDKAVAFGSRFIEFDVMLSADQEAFVFHDEHLTRTTSGQGEIGLVSADYLKSLEAGSWFSKRFLGEKIPTLSDMLRWLILHNVHANIEIKPYPGMIKETTIEVLAQINRYWPADKPLPLVSSFHVEALSLCRSMAPEIPIGFLLHVWDEQWLTTAEALNCTSIHLNKQLVTAARVREMKDKGYLVYAYTVNNQAQASKLLDSGVDAVFSDYPDLLLDRTA